VARLAAAADRNAGIAAEQLSCFVEHFDIAAQIERPLRNRRPTRPARTRIRFIVWHPTDLRMSPFHVVPPPVVFGVGIAAIPGAAFVTAAVSANR
jgi:hypothetical protein